jgi:hypothetical protein
LFLLGSILIVLFYFFKDYPIKLSVYPNKEVLMINENLNGVKIGGSAKLALRLNNQKTSLNIRITR